MYGSRLRIHTSNRLETLLEQLAATLRAQPLDPLEREVVVVRSRGMYRWLVLELARSLGVAATLATPFPGTFMRALAERIEGRRASSTERYEPSAPSLFDPELLVWAIYALLGGGDAEIAGPAARYLADDADGRKRHQLASRLAERFDEYQLYRIDWLEAWERGKQPIRDPHARESAGWQAALWRTLVAEAKRAGETSPVERRRALAASIESGRVPAGALPRRLHVFGASALSPSFLALLDALAKRIDVSIYVVEPTAEHWSELRPARVVERQLDFFRERGIAEADAHVEVGNELLASLGRHGSELHADLQRLDEDGSAWTPLRFSIAERTSVLGVVQADIAEIVDRRDSALNAAPRMTIAPDDRSLQVHVCHSPMREMEVLRDLLLDAFAADASLRPHDVLVLAPSITEYAPYIEAVFGVERTGEPGIEPALPFTIADRSARNEQPVVEAAMRILDLAGGRAPASAVLGLLDFEAVRRAARIDADEASAVIDWVRATNIHWGVDAEHRRSNLGVECDDADTWRSGIDRLLMGYAVGASEQPVAGTLPSALAAADPDLLGRAAAYLDTLLDSIRRAAAPRTLAHWSVDLPLLLDRLLAPESEAEHQALQSLRDLATRLGAAGERCGVAEVVPIEVVRAELRARLDASAGGAGFLTGAITFCALEPMRAIPAKIVCVAGLGDGVFPRLDRRPSFDLMTSDDHRPGDPSPRDEDRQLFLDTLLSARERLVLSYVGRSHKDNSALAPSIVLSELLDHVDRCFVAEPQDDDEEDGRASRALVVEHALQPFSETYFTAEPRGGGAGAQALFSYSQVNHASALALRAVHREPEPFVRAPLAGEPELLELTPEELARFWKNPSKAFCNDVLRLRLPWRADEIEDCEPFSIDGLTRYRLVEQLVGRRVAGRPDGEAELAALRAEGVLPLAGFARAAYEDIRSRAASLAHAVAAQAGPLPQEIHSEVVDLSAPGWRVVGPVEGISPHCLLRYRAAKVGARDVVGAWVALVVLGAWRSLDDRESTLPDRAVLVGNDLVVHLRAPENARALLGDLVEGYREGRLRPPAFFAAASRAYTDASRDADPRKAALAEALKKFEGTRTFGGGRVPGDGDDPYVALCTRDLAPLEGADFSQRALAFWNPVLDHLTETKR